MLVDWLGSLQSELNQWCQSYPFFLWVMETPTALRNLTIAFLSLFTPPVPLESRCSYRYCFGLLDRWCFWNYYPFGNGRERQDQRIRSLVMICIVLFANWVRATGPFAHTGALTIATIFDATSDQRHATHGFQSVQPNGARKAPNAIIFIGSVILGFRHVFVVPSLSSFGSERSS